MSEQPRSRRQTRAAILGQLLQSGGMFRPPLAKAVRLSEASLSRILFDLKAEGLIEEVRRPAPYFGGPTALVSLDNSVRLAAFELTGTHLSVGLSGRRSSHRTGGNGAFRSQSELTRKQFVRSPLVHHQHDQVRRRSANLETYAAALNADRARRRPASSAFAPTGYVSFSILAA